MTTQEYLIEKYDLLMTVNEVASILRRDAEAVYRALAMDTFPVPVVKVGRRRLFHSADVAEFIDNQRKDNAE